MILKNVLLKLFSIFSGEDENFSEIIKKSLTAFAIKILSLVMSFVLIYLISTGYGPEILGIYSLSLTLLQVFSVLGKSGMDVALMKFVSELSTQKKWEVISRISVMVLKIVLPLSVLISIMVCLYSPEIAEIVFHKSNLSKYFKIISIGIVPNILLMINSEKLRGLKEIHKYSFIRNVMIPFIASLFLGISFFFVKTSIIPVIVYVSAVICTFFISSFLWRSCFSKKREDVGESESGLIGNQVGYRSLLRFSLPMLLTNSLVLLMGWTDTIMLGMFRTTYEVGIYRVPLKLASLTSMTLVAVNTILGPKIAQLWKQQSTDEFRKMVKQSTMLIFWTSFPLSLFLGIFRFPVLGIFGPGFKSGSVALILLITAQLFNFIVGSTGLILIMTGRQFVFQNVVILGTIINVVLNYYLIPVYGINGAAFASMISMGFINIVPFFLIKKYYGFYTLSKRGFFLK